MPADTLSRIINLELTEPNLPERQGCEYEYVMFEQLPDIHADTKKHNPVPPACISTFNATNDNTVQNKDIEDTEILLSLNTKELIDGQNIDAFWITILKFIKHKKVSQIDIFKEKFT